MDTDDLLKILDALDNESLSVTPSGMLMDGNADEYDPDQVAIDAAMPSASIERLRKVLAWAKQAPERKAVKVPATPNT